MIDCSVFPRLQISDISPGTFIGWFVSPSQIHAQFLVLLCFWRRFYSEEIASNDGISFIYFYNIEFPTGFQNLFWHSADMRQKDCLSSQLNYSYISFQRRWYDFWVVVTLKVFRMLISFIAMFLDRVLFTFGGCERFLSSLCMDGRNRISDITGEYWLTIDGCFESILCENYYHLSRRQVYLPIPLWNVLKVLLSHMK